MIDRSIDVTKGNLSLALVQLAWPSVLQAVLSNCYTVSDFFFVGHLSDPVAAAAGTEGIAASVGLSICLFGLHNVVPSGCTAFSSQFKGADDKAALGKTFKTGFWACLVLSSLVALVGHTFIHAIALIPHSTPLVTENIEKFLGTLILASPCFGLLLLVDGFFKSNGNTLFPFFLEVGSLVINILLNWLFVFRFNWGIRGSAAASAMSRLLPAMLGLARISNGHLNGIEVNLFSLDGPGWTEINELCDRGVAMCRLGAWQSVSDWTYGFVFTVLIRLSGALGAAEQAGLGAGMRGLEWISFCVSEGFLVANLTAVGNLIGANLQRRANLAAMQGAIMSGFCGFVMGLPFIFYSEPIARLLSNDPEIVRFCAQYTKLQGFVSFGVGFEIAAYGAFIGAGKAREVFLTNGSMNLLRVPIASLCMFGSSGFWRGLTWALGINGKSPPVPTGDFLCICWVIAGTAVCKAALFAIWLNLRWFRGTYFHDSSLLQNCSTAGAAAETSGSDSGSEDLALADKVGGAAAYIELSQVSEHGGGAFATSAAAADDDDEKI